ncbi:MAG TPA: tetratricopeptide repeat protein, partial [Candidatus Omnitrophota bacterium]|nr:tetratricopeptide repeat protein [Candidatus Omnitrophota bacterium]
VYDDELVVTKNPFLSSFYNIRYLFSPYYFAGSGEFTYRPMVTLSYLADHKLWGFNPFGYHLTNVILHIANGVLLYFLCLVLLPLLGKGKDAGYIAVLSSVFFLIHPVQTEVVNGIGFREDALLAASMFGCLIFYLKASAAKRPAGKFLLYTGSIIFFLLSLTSKEWGIVLIPIIVTADFFISGIGDDKKRCLRQIPYYAAYTAVLAVYTYIFVFIMRNPAMKLGIKTAINLYQDVILTGSRYVAYYIKLLVLPVDLSVEYLFPKTYSIMEPSIFFSILAVLAAVLFIYISYKKDRVISFAGTWVLVLTGPMILFPYQSIAERFLYLPCAGFSLLIASLFVKSYGSLKRGKWVVTSILVMVILFYCARTVTRNAVWKDPVTFWETRLRSSVGTARAYSSLGDIYLAKGLLDKAEWAYNNALAVNGDYADAHNNLGSLYS